MEDSLELLKKDPTIINVWLREINDTNGHPVNSAVYKTKTNKEYHFLTTNYLDRWHGFTFNPAIKRVADYTKIAPFENVGHEGEISNAYYELGKATIFLEGSVKHNGWHRRVLDADKKRCKLILETDAWLKKKKASFYKAIGIFGKNINHK